MPVSCRSVRREVGDVAGIGMVIVGIVIAVVALTASDEPVPSVGRVVCGKDGVRVATPQVVARSDGMRLEVENIGKERRFEIGSLAEAGQPVTGVLPRDGIARLQLSLAPGEVEFACLRVGTGERLVGRIELLDPDGLWTPAALACDDPESGVVEIGYADEGFGASVRRALAGLQDRDALVRPGYPETAWHGDLHVVLRDGENVGRVVRVLERGSWNLTVDACPGSGLARGAAAEVGAT